MTLQKEPVRILQVVTSLNPGGIENYLMNLYRHIDRSVLQFDFLVHRNEPGLYEKEVEELGGVIYRVPRANPLNPGYLIALETFFSKHSYRVVHAHLDCMSAFVLKAAKRHAVSTRVAHSHNSSQDMDLKYPIKIICKRLIPKYATDLFACGERAGEWMFNGASYTVQPNAIDLHKFEFSKTVRRSIRRELDVPQDAFVIGHVGRFNKVKNQGFLLEVERAICARLDNVFLVYVGDGDQRCEVQAMAVDMGISDKVRFAGVRNDVCDCMSAFDVFALPSLYEGLPLVLVEAQTSGLPCLITNTIPSDCDLTSLIRRLPLDHHSWAKEIISLEGGVEFERKSNVSELASRGFEVSVAAENMQRFYLDRAGR